MNALPGLLLFTKPARPGRVKTRLVGAQAGERRIDATDAARLHAALLGDVAERLREGAGRLFRLRVAWDIAPEEALPPLPEGLAGRPGVDATRQRGRDLGERLFRALAEAAREHPVIAAVGSDHPSLPLATVRRGLEAVAGAQGEVALAPSLDGGYGLIAVRRESLSPRLFERIDWSTGRVHAQTCERCRELGLRVVELPAARDVDRAEDVVALAAEIAALEAAGQAAACPRTRALLAEWGLLPRRPAPLLAADQGRPACVS